MKNSIEINWEALTEVSALLILGVIAVVAMCALGANGKEIALAIGSGIGGYLAKAAMSMKQVVSDKSEKE